LAFISATENEYRFAPGYSDEEALLIHVPNALRINVSVGKDNGEGIFKLKCRERRGTERIRCKRRTLS
jgi:hypothetical protein